MQRTHLKVKWTGSALIVAGETKSTTPVSRWNLFVLFVTSRFFYRLLVFFFFFGLEGVWDYVIFIKFNYDKINVSQQTLKIKKTKIVIALGHSPEAIQLDLNNQLSNPSTIFFLCGAHFSLSNNVISNSSTAIYKKIMC